MENHLLLQKLKTFEQDTTWLDRHYDELKMRYFDEWVAVFKKEVVAHEKDLENLMLKLQDKYGKDAGHIAVRFVSPKKVELIL